MAERKYVKLKVNMYEDTKSKIIDRMIERDLIHYIWIRLVTLAGIVNLEGILYMSKNIPYTIETLAIEFNRDVNQIKLALDVFMELEMIECAEDNVYRVKNFAKHQNIKVKETIKAKSKEDNINIKKVEIKEDLKKEIDNNEEEEINNKKGENKIVKVKTDEGHNLEIKDKDIKKIDNRDIGKIDDRDIKKIDNTICDEKINNKLKDNIPIVLEEKKNKKANKGKSKNTKNIDEIEMDEGNEENRLIQFYAGDKARPLQEDECVVEAWAF